MTEKDQKKDAQTFATYWKGKGYEKGESQKFWIDLLEHVYRKITESECVAELMRRYRELVKEAEA